MLKRVAKFVLSRTPYRVVRTAGVNRFECIEACVQALANRGYSPKVIIDGGAHLGWFSLMAQKTFPNATFHLIDPQPACAKALSDLCADRRFIFHPYALNDRQETLGLAVNDEPTTGAHVSNANDAVPVASMSLDDLFNLTPDDHAFIKLDLQGYELHALRGGKRLLKSAEVILAEVSFYAQAYEPPIAELMSFLAAHDFRLYDIASLSGRMRDNRLHGGDFIFVREGTKLMEDESWA